MLFHVQTHTVLYKITELYLKEAMNTNTKTVKHLVAVPGYIYMTN